MPINQYVFFQNEYYSPYMDVVGDLFPFTSFKFHNGSATGKTGPSLENLNYVNNETVINNISNNQKNFLELHYYYL